MNPRFFGRIFSVGQSQSLESARAIGSRRRRMGVLAATSVLTASLCVTPFVSQAAVSAGLPEFTQLVESNGGAVVNISTTTSVKRTRSPHLNIPGGPRGPFEEWFKDFEDQMPEQFDSKSLGSGFVISADGYILTAAHVVKDAKEVIVKLMDRRELPAKIVGSDPRSDVALLKVDAANLPKVTIGDPGKLKTGEWVLAIGSPFGFENTATAGIVSAKGRSLPRENYVPFIQTDVAINPGNSGGPLFNLDGQVVGINTQIFSRTGGFMGLSFAVPIDMAMQVSKQLRATGKVKRGWLGVTIQDVTRELGESFGMKNPHGALISEILPNGPAAKSELKAGDVVTEFEGRSIASSAELPPLVGQTAPGAHSKLTVLRGGQTREVLITIGQLPDETQEASAADEGAPEGKTTLGLALRDLTPEQKKELGAKGGVLVERVVDGPAARAGIRPGDVITQFNQKPVQSVRELQDVLAKVPKDKTIPVLVRRGEGSMFIALKLKE